MRYLNVFGSAVLLLIISPFMFLTSGCVATQDWVKQYVPEQIFPVNKRLSDTEANVTQMGGRVSGVEG